MLQFVPGFIQGFTITAIILIISVMIYYLFIKDNKKSEKKEETKAKPTTKLVGYKRFPTNIRTVKDLKDYLNNKDDDEPIIKLIKIEHDELDYNWNIVDISITLQGKGRIFITLKD